MPLPVLPLTIRELGGQNRSVTLTGANLPRIDQAPSFGVGQRTKTEWYIGSQVPTSQILGPEEDPIVFGGMFEDRKTVKDGALALTSQLESMARDGRPVRLSWGPYVRRCTWGYFRPKPLHLQRIGWEIRLESLGPESGKPLAVISGARPLPSIGDVLQASRDLVTIAQQIVRLPGRIVDEFEKIVGSVESIGESILDLKRSVGQERKQIAASLVRSADSIDRSLRIAYTTIHSIDIGAETTGTDYTRAIGIRANVRRASVQIIDARQELGKVRRRLERLSGFTQSVEVYQVHDGEALQRVALRRLGDASRAAEVAAANGLITWGLVGGSNLKLESPDTDRTAAT